MQNTFYEFGEVSNDKLSKFIKETDSLHQFFKQDWQKISATQYCGFIYHDNEDFYILPKISEDNNSNLTIFTYMLAYVHNINIKNEDFASSANFKSNTILEFFITLFAQNLFTELQKGIYKTYITEQDNLKALKGKFLIDENIKYNFAKNKIFCEYDEFTPNNNLNQLFLYAIKTLQRFTQNKKLLKQCELALDEINFVNININKLNIHFDRQNQRFKPSYDLAIMLLQKLLPLFANGKKSFAFLFDMNKLFEDFIGKLYNQIDTTTQTQKEFEFGNLTLKPDILTKNLIIDTKYKIVEPESDISTQDKYQMYVYGRNFNKDAMLLYPKHILDVNKNLILGTDEIVNLKIKSIDLFSNTDYLKYISFLKQEIQEI